MNLEKMMKTKMAKKLFKEAGYSDEEISENIEMVNEMINIEVPEDEKKKQTVVRDDNKDMADIILLGISEGMRITPPINQAEFDGRFEYDLLELKYLIAERMGNTTLELRIISDIDTAINSLLISNYTVELRLQQILHILELWDRLCKWQSRLEERRNV